MARRERPAPRPTGTAIAATVAVGVAMVAVIVIAVLLLVSGGHRSSPSAATASAAPEPGFEGAALPGPPAPNFTLADLQGRPVSLEDYRGRVVVLTFLYSTCGASCVLIAQQIRGALNELRRPATVLVVSADPSADTAANVNRFLAQVSLSGRVHYLVGSPAQLGRVWRAYRVVPASAGERAFANSASVLLIDGEGRERVLFQQEQLTPESLSHDIGKLQGG